jgi:hypothetical protein
LWRTSPQCEKVQKSADFLGTAACCDYLPLIVRRELSRTRVAGTTVRLLLEDVSEGIRVLQTRDGVSLSEDQIVERARNIVAGLIGNYRIQSLDARETPSAREPSRGARTVDQLNLLDQVEKRAEARQNGRPVRA